MKNKLIACLMILTISYACTEKETEEVVLFEEEEISRASLDQTINSLLNQNGEFDWSSVSSSHIATALQEEEAILTIGYQPNGFRRLPDVIHEIDIKSAPWVAAKEAIINDLITAYRERGTTVKREEFVIMDHETLPYIKVVTADAFIVERVRNSPFVRYAEPTTYTFREVGSIDIPDNGSGRIESGSGCGNNGPDNINSADFSTISPGAALPWNYAVHNIPAAWQISQGDNIGIGLIDTGISPDQAKLNSQFSSGQSTGRTITKFGTYPPRWWSSRTDGPNDQCGHGTQMSGAMSAPRTSSGSSVGVAFKANLVSVRGTSDVLVNTGREKDGVSDALVLLGNRSDVKIISMSIGDLLSSGQVKDAIRFAYNRGKLIFAAAGTSTSFTSFVGVIFPANLSETVAVTGIRDNELRRCNICHDGSKVDFVVTMQRGSDGGRTSLTLADSGNRPSYVGGSSVATAQTAGMAALVWARNPSQSRAQVLDKLKRASQFYPNRNRDFGYGKIDALKAVMF